MPPRLCFPALVLAVSSILVGVPFAPGDSPEVKHSNPPSIPALAAIAPTGCQRGSGVDATLNGTGFADPLAVWLGAAGHVTLSPSATTRKDSTKSLAARVDIPPNSPMGVHRLRLATTGGLSNFRPFCVDAFPEIGAIDKNHSPAAAQLAAIPCVISGRVDPETSDYFKFTVTSAKRVSFEVLARRLGSSLDPVLRLHERPTSAYPAGREIPGAYSDDAPGLQADARLTYTFATAGEYLVEVRDTIHRGGQDFWYRLRIGDFPCAVTPLPAAAKHGSKVAVGFAGPQVEGTATVELQVPADPAVEALSVTPIGSNGLPGWPVTLLLSDHDEVMAADNIGALAQAQRLTLPCGVTGRFLRKGQKDHFAISAIKGQRFRIAAQTAELLSPAEIYLSVRDGAGYELTHTDPQREPVIDFTAPADGSFFIVAEQLNYAFGPSEVYRLTVAPPMPGFDLALVSDRVAVPQGQTALIPVASLRRRDFGGPIELSIVGQSGLSGSVTVPAGMQSESRGADATPVAFVPINATSDLAPGAYEVKVMAKGLVDGKEIVAFASTRAAVQAQMDGLTHPPREWLRGVGVAVTPKPPVTLAAIWERPDAVRGLVNRLVVVANRDAGFDSDISVSAIGLPPGVTATTTTIPAGKAEAVLEFKINEKAELGSFAFTVVGRTRQDDRVLTATLVPPHLVVALPFDLKIEPNPVSLEAGSTVLVNVIAVRKGGYSGPIELELRNLPAEVKIGKASIALGKSSTQVTLAATAGAPLGSRGDVDVLGTAALGNQQAASPPFTVRVQSPPPALSVKVEPAAVSLKTGGKIKAKVTIERKYFAGPVAITFEGLPAKVSAAAATIPPEQSTVDIELSAGADAESAKADATVTAKAAATGTAKLTIKVDK